MLEAYSGFLRVPYSSDDLDHLCIPHQGLFVEDMEEQVKIRFGRFLSGFMDLYDLRHFLATERPVICMVVAAGEGHWVTAIGFDPIADTVTWQCPWYGPVTADTKQFLGLWDGYGCVPCYNPKAQSAILQA